MLVFDDMLKVYSGQAAIFSNLSLQKCYFRKFYFFSDHVYFQLLWFLKRAVAEALNLLKLQLHLGRCSLLVKYLILVSGWIYFVLEFHEKNFTGLKLVAMATVCAWISREPFDRIDFFFLPTFFFC